MLYPIFRKRLKAKFYSLAHICLLTEPEFNYSMTLKIFKAGINLSMRIHCKQEIITVINKASE